VTGSEIYAEIKLAENTKKCGKPSPLQDRCREIADALLELFVAAGDYDRRKIAQILDGKVAMPGPMERVRLDRPADLLGISRRTVIRHMKNGTIPTATDSSGKKYIIGKSLSALIQTVKSESRKS